MSDPSNSHAQTAMQLLVWALEEIEKAGNMEAEQYARSALDAIRKSIPPDNLVQASITEL